MWRFHANVPKRSFDRGNNEYPDYLQNIIYKQYDSDTLEFLATMAFQKDKAKIDFFNEVQEFMLNTKDVCDRHNVNYFWLLSYLSVTMGNFIDLHDQAFTYTIQKDPKSEDFVKELRSSYKKLTASSGFKTILHAIKKDINDFEPRLNILDLVGPYIAEPAITNSRIREQGGYFLFTTPIIKIGQSISSIRSLTEMESILFMNDNKIIVDRNSKPMLKKHLDLIYGINKSTLFPDMYSTAEYLRDDNPFEDTRVYPIVAKGRREYY